jgi:hypothetical protein
MVPPQGTRLGEAKKMQTALAEYRKKILLGAILAVIITASLAASSTWIAAKTPTAQAGNAPDVPSQLIVELTDPPSVPSGTSSLNLTYTEMELSVLEPSQPASQTIMLIPGGGSTTLDLMDLENTSQTLALANVPAGTQVLAATFLVSKVAINVGGNVSSVSLATGGNALQVVLSNQTVLQGTENVLLLQLSPAVLNGSSGYQLVPSSVAVFKPQSEISENEGRVGFTQQLSTEDVLRLRHAKGSISADLLSLDVSGNTTTMSIQVTNTGKIPERLLLFEIQGDFQWQCSSSRSEGYWLEQKGCEGDPNVIVLLPGEPHNASSQTTNATCAPRHISEINGPDIENELANPIVMNPGQCLMFSFSGTISLGNHILVPALEPGQKYSVQVFAANGAKEKLECSFLKNARLNCSTNGDGGSD